jgi:hypothetical protein
MKLPLDGIEYLRWTVNADGSLATANLQVALKQTKDAPLDSEWQDVPWSGADTATTSGTTTLHTRPFRLLLAGPEAGQGNPRDAGDQPLGAATVLPEGTTFFWIRVLNTPEVLIRQAGRIKVSD